ncbi:MAG: LPS-assembly protein LptD, partial [Psychrobacter sp.]|nr:LPS-assembly protein LptD [Psychrobacter sp.]
MLYSPLYQSIRLILFGALGLSSLAVSAAINNDAQIDTQTTEPLAVNSASAYAPKVAADVNNNINNNINTVNQDVSYQSDYKQNTGFDNNLDSNTIDITEINDSSDSNNANANDNNQNNTATPLDSITTAETKVNNRQVNDSDDSIQESLRRLAEFYELTPETDPATLNNNSNANVADNNQNDIQNTFTARTIPAVGNDLKLLPNSVDSAQRCEGQWVYPKKNPNYQRAVNETGVSNGQPVPNLNGIPNNQAPLFAESDYGYYDNVDYAELSGNVIVDQGTQHIEADKIIIDLNNNVAAAQGKVMFTDQATGNGNASSIPSQAGNVQNSRPYNNNIQNNTASLTDKASKGGLIGVADSLNYNTETGQSTASDVAFASVELQAHGYAKRLNRPNETQYELDEVLHLLRIESVEFRFPQ